MGKLERDAVSGGQDAPVATTMRLPASGSIAPHEDTFESPAWLADLIGHTQGTLAQWRYKGVGPAYVKLGGKVRYRRSAVMQWIAAQEASANGSSAA